MESKCSEILRQHLRDLAAAAEKRDLPDHKLLNAFVRTGDETAFATLVQRHGSMVLGVCNSVLHQLQDAEDTCQATFLALARKARSLRDPEHLSGWLYGVAYRTALKQRTARSRRRAHEAAASPKQICAPVTNLSYGEVNAIIYEELARLPEHLRAPIILCHLESRARDEAANQLGLSLSTLKSRLEQGKKRLASRLRRRGIELSALGVLGLAPQAVLPAAFIQSTVAAASRVATGTSITTLVSERVGELYQGIVAATLGFKARLVVVMTLALCIATGVFWRGHFATEASDEDDGRSKNRAVQAPKRPDQPGVNDAAPAGEAAARAQHERRKHVLNELCVPRLIAALEGVAGKAHLKEAFLDGDEAHVSLHWQPPFLAPLTVAFRYHMRSDEFLVWRDLGDGMKRFVEPSAPIYLDLWRNGPRIVYGVAQVQEMEEAFKLLKREERR